ncbi:MAG: head GIN domain-containing protein [Pseudolysinimonas sp.]
MTNRTARTVPALLLAAALTASLAGCVYLPLGGPRVTEDRDIDDVTAVVLKTDGDVVITVGDTPSLTIKARPAAMGLLTSDSEDGILTLGVNGPHLGLGEVDYVLTVTEMSDVRIEGAGDIDVDFTGADDVTVSIQGSGDIEGAGIDASKVTSSIAGSGDIQLTGRADEHTLTIDGSGNFDGQDFETKRARVSIAGSGDIEVNVTDHLDADISGSGEIRYTGGRRGLE